MRINSSFGNQTRITRARQSVYSGQHRLGDVAQRDDGFEARDRRGKIIGTFESALAAADAVSAADNSTPEIPANAGRPAGAPGKQ